MAEAPPDLAATVGAARTAAHAALRARDFEGAVTLWMQVATGGGLIGDWMNLAAACRAAGRLDKALEAVDQALTINPRYFMALILRASLLEKAGRMSEARPTYGDALAVAPDEATLDEATRRALHHARSVNRAYGDDLGAHLHGRIGSGDHTPGEVRRVGAFVDFMLGRRTNYRQEPLGYFYPGLPAIEFWDREEFPWLTDLEAATGAIQQELHGVLAGEEAFTPYIDYPDSAPLDQWRALNRSPRWGAYHLLENGKRVEAHCLRCPKTMEVLAEMPQPDVANRSPSAMFSALHPHTHIPRHTGVSNTRLVVHLPLIVPDGCWFRVGNETRTYAPNQAWVFDDTIDHEAMNNSDEGRVILLFDIWNPRLSLWEREMIAELSAAHDAFHGKPV